MAQIETSHEIRFQVGVGEHKLRFSPKEQFKNELSLRSLTLPVVNLKGTVRRRERTKAPQVSVEVGVKTINIDLTTDILNQLLIVQNSFIKVSILVQLTYTHIHTHVFESDTICKQNSFELGISRCSIFTFGAQHL